MLNKHLIGKQILEIEINSSKEAYAIQQKMSQFIWKELTPRMNDLFDTIAGKDQVLYVDSIEIDIGYMNPNNLDKNKIINKIIQLLEDEIRKEITNLPSTKEVYKFGENIYFNKTGDVNEHSSRQKKEIQSFKNKDTLSNTYVNKTNDIDDKISGKVTSQPLKQYYFNAWLYWLEKGTLPSYSIIPEDNWISLVLETLVLDTNAVTQLKTKIKSTTVALQRLVVQHTPEDLKSIVEIYTGFSQTEIIKFLKEIETVFKQILISDITSISFRALEIEIWKQIFVITILKMQKRDSTSLIKQTIQHLVSGKVIDKKEWNQILNQIINTNKDTSFSVLKEIYKEEIVIRINKESIVNQHKKNTEAILQQETKDTSSFVETVMESPQFFSNAGVVVLHPFLNSFFKKLDLIEGKNFKDNAAKSKAVILLHFLATGEEHPREYEMVLPKFLCEMPVNMPLDHTIQITKEEKEEADNLLQAAISHWGALGSTSPDGLREGFLSREGKLEKEQTGWRLFVEQKTLDILLDRLPWSISILKLPWMSEMLNVEWR